ncbi:MAG: DUF2997 domain-containing protein [Euryarchaeota archaeon]|nr:DUF2997 domain-containing protein [Euryarchaeota archaeon]MDE1879455.1 DUF2997 domain-containing protein [Euryarchaeota archaeon]
MARVTITIDTEGHATMKVDGVQGQSCVRLTRDLERALGRTTKDVKTSDFYATPKQSTNEQRKETA